MTGLRVTDPPDRRAAGRDPWHRGVILTAFLILSAGLLGFHGPQWMHGVRGPRRQGVGFIRVEIKGVRALEGIYEIASGTRLSAFLRDLGVQLGEGDAIPGPGDRLLEDLQEITLREEHGRTCVKIRPMAPGKAFLLGSPLDINRARLWELALLPGVGSVTARRILDVRAARGPFESVDDLTVVRGISRKKAERIRPFVVFHSS